MPVALREKQVRPAAHPLVGEDEHVTIPSGDEAEGPPEPHVLPQASK